MDKTELLALVDRIEARVAEGNKKHGFVRAALHYDEAPIVIAALRLASRLEVSVTVEELAQSLRVRGALNPNADARALLAEYSITKREG